MLKRKVSVIKKAPEPKPRKKQAVTKTYKPSTIALIRQNAANSPLLSLPSEVRERILKHLLGERLIHIRYLNKYEEEDFNTIRSLTKKHADKEGSFRHTICSNLNTFNTQEEAFGGDARHKECTIYEAVAFREEKSITLSASAHCPMKGALVILSVCRQLYEESNFILWSTNTFSFDHGGSLVKFVSSLNPAQKRNMKKLHIIASPDQGVYWTERWSEACTSKYLSMFRGLESLSLCIEHHLMHSNYLRPILLNAEKYDELWKQYMERVGLVSLRILPLKHVYVVISDSVPKYGSRSVSVHYLSEELKAKYTGDLREKLLDPRGAEVQQALNAEASKNRREEAARYNEMYEARRLRTAQEKVQITRRRLIWSEEQATRCENTADQALENLNAGNYMPKKKYEQLEMRARKARGAADKAADSLKVWEGRLNQRQKLANAKTAKAVKAAKMEGAKVDDFESAER